MKIIEIHPENSDHRKLNACLKHLKDHGVLACPSDSGYVLLAHLGDAKAIDAIRQIRAMEKKHLFSLICLDISQLSEYVHISTPTFRLIKRSAPAAITFILDASKKIPKVILQPKKRQIGIRIPDHPLLMNLLKQHNEPLLCIGLLKKSEASEHFEPMSAYEISERFGHPKLWTIDCETCAHEWTTIVDCTGIEPILVRQGKGEIVW